MAIRYFIFQTRLQNELKHIGRVMLKGTYDQQALVGRMLEMGTSLTKPDITAVLQLLSSAIERVCSEGYKVNLDGLIQVTPAIGGLFTDKADNFQTPRNSLYLTAQVSKSLNDRITQGSLVEKVVVDENRPILVDVIDSEADADAMALTKGNIVAISGKRLKFDQTQGQEYLRLVNAQNPTEYLAVTKFHKVSDQELVFRLPQATFNEGYFEMASTLNTSSLRVGRSPAFLMEAA